MPLTLVPATLARRGLGFTFAGPSGGPECMACPVRRLCFGLEAGRRYEVQTVRDVVHPCALHEGGKVRVAEVAEATFAASIERRHLRGTAAAWSPPACGTPHCGNYGLCHPVGPIPGRHEIVEAGAALDCPAGLDVARVRLKPLP